MCYLQVTLRDLQHSTSALSKTYYHKCVYLTRLILIDDTFMEMNIPSCKLLICCRVSYHITTHQSLQIVRRPITFIHTPDLIFSCYD